MLAVTSALIAAALLGIWFSTTRWISVGAFALLCLLYPWLTVVVLIAVIWAFYFFKIRKP